MAVMYTGVGGYIGFNSWICQIAENQSDLDFSADDVTIYEV